MRHRISLFLIILFMAASVSTSNSLWTSSTKSFYADPKAGDIGDIVIIKAKVTPKQATPKVSNEQDVTPPISSKSSTTETKPAVPAPVLTPPSPVELLINARVEKRDSNGIMFIRGIKKVNINGEEHILEISGYVRPKDLKADNSVEVSFLTEPIIKYNGIKTFQDMTTPSKVSDALSEIYMLFI